MGDVAAAPCAVAAATAAATAAQEETLTNLPLESVDLPVDMLCCVCLTPSLDNVMCCANGHNACRTCADKLRNGRCPQSCGPLHKTGNGWMSNGPLNSLMRETQLLCPFSKDGCPAKYKICNIKSHMLVCGFRTVKCPCAFTDGDGDTVNPVDQNGCDWTGLESKLSQHLVDVDHGRFAFRMMLTHHTQLTRLHERFDALHARLTSASTAQQNCAVRVEQVDDKLVGIQEVLETIKDHTDKKDGSSARSVRRHKTMSEEILKLKRERTSKDSARDLATQAMKDAHTEAYRELGAELETVGDDLLSSQRERSALEDDNEELRRDLSALEDERDENCEIAAAQFRTLRKQRDDAVQLQEDLRNSRQRKVARVESLNLSLEHSAMVTHEMHTVLSRMLPSATSGKCPCHKCV